MCIGVTDFFPKALIRQFIFLLSVGFFLSFSSGAMLSGGCQCFFIADHALRMILQVH